MTLLVARSLIYLFSRSLIRSVSSLLAHHGQKLYKLKLGGNENCSVLYRLDLSSNIEVHHKARYRRLQPN